MRKHLISFMVAAGLVLGGASHATFASTVSAGGTKKASSAKKVHKKVAVKKRAASQKKVHATYKKNRSHAASASFDDPANLVVQSSAVLVQDEATGAILYEKNADAVVPIASITKLMTAMVTLDANPSLTDQITIDMADVDTLKGTSSRLRVGTTLSREEMLRLALMSSENRAASSLARYYPGGRSAFIAAMNAKAKMLGLTETRFEDSTGLTAANVSSARDLVRMVSAAHTYPLIREFSTTAQYNVVLDGRSRTFRNTNPLVRVAGGDWEIGLSKTGYINEAGKCLVMQAWFNNKPTIIVLLDSWGKLTRVGDANRIKRWMESSVARRPRTS